MQTFDQKAYIQDLETLVNLDSPSYEVEKVEKIADFLKSRFEKLGFFTEKNFFDKNGFCFVAKNKQNTPFDILFIGHMDTVFPSGEVEKRPFSIKGDYAYGPGVADMKGGILLALYALENLKKTSPDLFQKFSIGFVCNSDEEISSQYSAPFIKEICTQANYALVLEPGRVNGALVTARRGVGTYRVDIEGIAAHSGINPQDGSSSIREAAHWILALENFTDPEKETNVNIGLISGGVSKNTVPPHTHFSVDLRFDDEKDAQEFEELMDTLSKQVKEPALEKTASYWKRLAFRPSFPENIETKKMANLLQEIAQQHNIPDVSFVKTGGASDASFSYQAGAKTIDGLGPVGGKSHTKDEYIELQSLAPRYALLKNFIQRLLQP